MSFSFIESNQQPKDEDAAHFAASAIDPNIDESLKQMSPMREMDENFIGGAPELQKKIFTEDDTLLFVRALQMARTNVSLDRLSQAINDAYHRLDWERFVDLGSNEILLAKIKNKLRSLNSQRPGAGPGPAEEHRNKRYLSAWYNEAEEQIKSVIEAARKHPQQDAIATPSLTGSSRRLRYTDAEETMFKHWMVQGKRRNYIFGAYRNTRSKESIIHKMKSVRKQFSRPPSVEGKEHHRLYTENPKGHFNESAPGYCAEGSIPEQDIKAFQDRIDELIKTRTLLILSQPEDDELDPYKTNSDSTSIDLNLLRHYVLMSEKVGEEFAKVQRHVLTADASWVEAATLVKRAKDIVQNALNLTKHRAGHELDGNIPVEDLSTLLDEELAQDETEAIVSMMQQRPPKKRRH